MENRKITYTIHIAATAEELWEALTNREALEKNWGKIESEWTAGSRVTEVGEGGRLLWQGEVLRSDRPHRLSFTFDETGSGEPATEVTFELSPPGNGAPPDVRAVRLTVTQAGFQENSKLMEGCRHAWTGIFSSFKSYLETGQPLRLIWKE